LINYTGLEYLQIDIASQFGLDKLNFEPRIAWCVKNEPQLEALIPKADDPFRYAAAVIAYRDTKAGKPTGHLVGLDACASGMQIMSAITGCPTGASNTGLTGQSRKDVYTIGTKVMNDVLVKNGFTGTSQPRSIVKPATMTLYYGSKAEPRNAFGEGTVELTAFYKAQSIVAPGAFELISTLIGTWQPYAEEHRWTMPDNFHVRNKVTVLRDTKIEVDELDHACFVYRHEANAGTKAGLANAANVVHSIDGFVNRELCYRCNHDHLLPIARGLIINELDARAKRTFLPYQGDIPVIEQLAKRHNFISLSGIEYITARTVHKFGSKYLRDMLNLIDDTIMNAAFEVITVHDEFKAHANNMNRVRKVYIEIFAELAESTILNAILSELTGEVYTIQPIDPNLGDKIRLGNYAIA
jgi:hypothetical protein